MKKTSFLTSFLLFVMVTITGVAGGTSLGDRENLITAFFGSAELQIETSAQKHELTQALSDTLNLAPEALKRKRYADYQGHKGKWTLPQILSAYFVPSRPIALEADRFYRDLGTDAAKAAVKKQLKALKATP